MNRYLVFVAWAMLSGASYAATIAFPNSLPSAVIEKRYASEIRNFEQVLETPLWLGVYNIDNTLDIRNTAQQGLIAAAPAQVTQLVSQGLTPVGYHDGYVDMVLVSRTAVPGDCPRMVHLPGSSTMGWLEPHLLIAANIETECHQRASSMANGLRLLHLDKADLVVSGAISLQRFVDKFGSDFHVLAKTPSPTFVFMSVPEYQDLWLERFKKIEEAGILAPNDYPVRAWRPAVLERYQRFDQADSGSS